MFIIYCTKINAVGILTQDYSKFYDKLELLILRNVNTGSSEIFIILSEMFRKKICFYIKTV
jgi:hypothetical protein